MTLASLVRAKRLPAAGHRPHRLEERHLGIMLRGSSRFTASAPSRDAFEARRMRKGVSKGSNSVRARLTSCVGP